MPIDMYAASSGIMTAEQEIAERVQSEVLPSLRKLLKDLNEMQEIWNTPGNGIPAKIIAAAVAQVPLAGYSPAVWVTWGEILLRLQGFLDTEFTITLPDGSQVTTTPKATLMTRYTVVQE